ncbi:hypothetical protein CLOM_g3535 [Closterium sp. NIES-68]|nr:hypothetical protein CLOM_g3535 [Closterium sp. NIES-68]GJP69807.1 hypothetical protein CLOP_g821 [Closterium sp. NIES-67]
MALSQNALAQRFERLVPHSAASFSSAASPHRQSRSPSQGLRSLRAASAFPVLPHPTSQSIKANPRVCALLATTDNICRGDVCGNHGEKRYTFVPGVTARKPRGRRPLLITAASASGVSGGSEPSRDAPSSSAVRQADAGHVAADVVRAAEAAVLAWWATAASWVKWPVAIFLPLFALVNIIFGAAAATDLTPLWLLGPLLLSASLRLSHSLHQLSLTLLHRTAPQRQLLLARGTELAGYLCSGNVPEDARKLLGKLQEEVEEKGRYSLSVVQERRAALVVYVNSGRMAEDVQSKAERWAVERWEQLCDWTIMRAEDTSDWLRVTRRRLGKVLEKVF